MSKHFVLLYGPPGSGKTTIGKMVYREINRSLFVDVDDLWRMQPFVVNDDNKKMVEDNILSVIGSFMDNPSLDTMIMVWVVHTKGLMDFFKTITCNYLDCTCTYIRLYAEEDVLKERMVLQGRDQKNIEGALEIARKYPPLEDYLIDTSEKELFDVKEEVLDCIKKDAPKQD